MVDIVSIVECAVVERAVQYSTLAVHNSSNLQI